MINKMRELIEDFKESFSEPDSPNDCHLFVFIFQTIILIIVSMLIFHIGEENEPALRTDRGMLRSYLTAFQNEEADKTLFKFPLLLEEVEDNVVHTDKLIDFKSGGIWLSKRQAFGIAATYIGVVLSPIVYLLLGIGRMYRRLRSPYFRLLLHTIAAWIFPPVGAAVWGVISLFFWYIVAFGAALFGLIMYPLHLILGIIQIPNIFKQIG